MEFILVALLQQRVTESLNMKNSFSIGGKLDSKNIKNKANDLSRLTKTGHLDYLLVEQICFTNIM